MTVPPSQQTQGLDVRPPVLRGKPLSSHCHGRVLTNAYRGDRMKSGGLPVSSWWLSILVGVAIHMFIAVPFLSSIP